MLILSDTVISLLQTTGKPHKYTVTICENKSTLRYAACGTLVKPDFCITIPLSLFLFLSLLENEHLYCNTLCLYILIPYIIMLYRMCSETN